MAMIQMYLKGHFLLKYSAIHGYLLHNTSPHLQQGHNFPLRYFYFNLRLEQ